MEYSIAIWYRSNRYGQLTYKEQPIHDRDDQYFTKKKGKLEKTLEELRNKDKLIRKDLKDHTLIERRQSHRKIRYET
jgi:hypothetical protein